MQFCVASAVGKEQFSFSSDATLVFHKLSTLASRRMDPALLAMFTQLQTFDETSLKEELALKCILTASSGNSSDVAKAVKLIGIRTLHNTFCVEEGSDLNIRFSQTYPRPKFLPLLSGGLHGVLDPGPSCDCFSETTALSFMLVSVKGVFGAKNSPSKAFRVFYFTKLSTRIANAVHCA